MTQLLGLLVVILGSARLVGILSRFTGQPAVLGELLAGILLGPSLLNWLDPQHQVLQMIAQIGVILLLFQIGLETDLRKLMRWLLPPKQQQPRAQRSAAGELVSDP